MESIYDHGSQDIRMVIVGHKADLQDERAVTTDEGKKVSESLCLRQGKGSLQLLTELLNKYVRM